MFANCPTPPLKKYVNLNGLPNKNFRACGVIVTACTIIAFENRSYLGDFEAEFKKALARESEAQEVLFDEKKTEGRKSRETVPSKAIKAAQIFRLLCICTFGVIFS
jgi:hypothetical protein